LGFKLFERSGYRLELTSEGAAVLACARRVLAEMSDFQTCAAQIAAGEESELTVVIGDLSPLPPMLGLLRNFFALHPQTRLRLEFAALSGPWELLLEERADLIVHHVEPGDARFETIPLRQVALIPVAAPEFLPFPTALATAGTSALRTLARMGSDKVQRPNKGASTSKGADCRRLFYSPIQLRLA
jgi:DNA-binding transcriptional LysR family regulator